MPTPVSKTDPICIGIDLGGTKIEALAIDLQGKEISRHRVRTPRFDYEGTIQAIVGEIKRLESETGKTGTVGVAIPGTISQKTGLVKNANLDQWQSVRSGPRSCAGPRGENRERRELLGSFRGD
jgi:predicted NBD/HSP70 family sugar kinase